MYLPSSVFRLLDSMHLESNESHRSKIINDIPGRYSVYKSPDAVTDALDAYFVPFVLF